MTDYGTIADRVDRGWRWLDESFPGWQERINVDTLMLSNKQKCICGQVFATEAEKAEDVSYGYDYARLHLFGQADSWITTLIGMDPLAPGERSVARSNAVSEALGFLDSSDWTLTEIGKEWKQRLMFHNELVAPNG